MITFITILYILCMIPLFWFIHCNNKTFSQRVKIIYEKDGWENCKPYFDNTSYEKHFWYLITFRDPMRLYE